MILYTCVGKVGKVVKLYGEEYMKKNGALI